jgi:hypothetical protein
VKDFVGVGSTSEFSVAQATAPTSTAVLLAHLSVDGRCSARKKYLVVLLMAAPITVSQRKRLSTISLAVSGFGLLDRAESIGILPPILFISAFFRRR